LFDARLGRIDFATENSSMKNEIKKVNANIEASTCKKCLKNERKEKHGT